MSKKARKRYYFWDSLIFSVVVTILNIGATFFIEKDWQHYLLFSNLSETWNIVVVLTLELVLSFVIFYAIAYVWEEMNVKRYNRKLADLEDLNE